jgi:hypothetical protein
MPNRFTFINSNSSTPALVNQINQNFAKLDNEGVTKAFSGANGKSLIQGKLPGDLGHGQVLYDPSGKAAIYMAIDSTGKPVLKVAKDGKDATTDADADMVFNSAQNVLKVVGSGTVTTPAFAVNGTAGQWNASNPSQPTIVEHKLGFTPAVIAYTDFGAGQYGLMPATLTQIVSATAITFEFLSATADSNFLYITDLVRSNGAVSTTAGNKAVKYYLLQETAA